MRSSDELEYVSDDGSTKPMDISLNGSLNGYSGRFWTQSSVANQFEASRVTLDDLTSAHEKTTTSEEEADLPSGTTPEKDKVRSRSTSVEDEEEELGDRSKDDRKKMRAALSNSMGQDIHSMANSK